MFVLKNVSKQFGSEQVLNDVTFNLGKGLNFIVGPSGSGKTTLLKILSGFETDYEGEVYYCGQNLKTLREAEKSQYYQHVFGFLWQDFNLLPELTVRENLLLPQYLQAEPNEKRALKLLADLELSEFVDAKVATLSGGQQQRVAFAREVLKNPQVMIVDEPTSALDAASAKIMCAYLAKLAETRIVIVVTHDQRFLQQRGQRFTFERDGRVRATPMQFGTAGKPPKLKPAKLTFQHAWKLVWMHVQRRPLRALASLLTLVIASALLLVSVSGFIGEQNATKFDQLVATYGEGIFDVNLVGSFTGASGTDDQTTNEPVTEVTQDIAGVYERYRDDARVSYLLSLQAYNDITVTLDGKSHAVNPSNSVPVLNKLVAGDVPKGDGFEVVIPASLLTSLNEEAADVIGQELAFAGAIYNWESGEPVLKPVHITAKIVGVADTTTTYEQTGEVMNYTIDDAFFFSQSAVQALRAQAGTEATAANFTIRAKSGEAMIAIKDELNAEGIVPLGQFELVERVVRLNNQTSAQTELATVVMLIIAVSGVLAVSVMTLLTRKREAAAYKLAGYRSSQLCLLVGIEMAMIALGASVCLMLLISLTKLGLTPFGAMPVTGASIGVGMSIIVLLSCLMVGITIVGIVNLKAETALRWGAWE